MIAVGLSVWSQLRSRYVHSKGGGGYGVNYPLGVDVIGAVGMGIGRVEGIAQIVLVELNEGGIGRPERLGRDRCG